MAETAPTAESLEALVGRTPVVQLSRVVPRGGPALHLKLGGLQPTGSEKDRLALQWLGSAARSGRLRPGQRLVVATSGNLGVSLAWLCASRGLSLTAVMPDSATLDRRQLLQAYGAEQVLTPAEEGMAGADARARELAQAPGSLLVDVWGSERPAMAEGAVPPAAAQAPMEHGELRALPEPPELGAELLETVVADGGRIDALVGGVGSGASLVSAALAVRAHQPSCRVVAVDSEASPLFGDRPARPHRLQGLGPGLRTPRLEQLGPDRVERVSDAEARAMQLRLGREEGMLVGISTGAVVVAALRTMTALSPEAIVYALGTDTGERDFSLEELFR